jgi:hypothetical protein
VGVPPKVTVGWLKTIGFTSSNDATLVGVLKFIGFTDASGVPTPTWSSYRGAKHRQVLGEAIRKGYAELFAIYPDANAQPNTELQHVFSTSSSAGEQVTNKTVATFRALVDEADFSNSDTSGEMTIQVDALHTPAATQPPGSAVRGGPEVHIDIQIHISPESTAQQIDKIFESMAKHLYGRRGDE